MCGDLTLINPYIPWGCIDVQTDIPTDEAHLREARVCLSRDASVPGNKAPHTEGAPRWVHSTTMGCRTTPATQQH